MVSGREIVHVSSDAGNIFLVYFKSSGGANYSTESFVLLALEKCLFSPGMSMQLKWNRTINVHGLPGRNVSCDLHIEHLN